MAEAAESELAGAAAWLERAPMEIASRIAAPKGLRRVEVLLSSNGREMSIEARWMTTGIGKCLAACSGKTLAEAVRKLRAALRERGLDA